MKTKAGKMCIQFTGKCYFPTHHTHINCGPNWMIDTKKHDYDGTAHFYSDCRLLRKEKQEEQPKLTPEILRILEDLY